jgi:WD40 repeat protein
MDIFREQNIVIVACVKEITVLQENRKVSSVQINYEASSLSANAETLEIAVGGDDSKVHIYKLDGVNLTLREELTHLGPVADVSYSPDNKYLVACDAHRKVVLYGLPDYKPPHNKEWGFHNARVNCVAWSPNSLLVASGSLDTTIIIWSVTNPAKHTIIKNAHPQSQITRLAWLNNDTVISTGQDCNTKIWNIEAI